MKVLTAALAAFLMLAVGVTAAQACPLGATEQHYVSCRGTPGALIVTYTCVDGIVWRQTNWYVLWGCGG